MAARRFAGSERGESSRVLLLGDGDGRFLEHALRVWPRAHFVTIDASAGMIAASKARNAELGAGRVQWVRGELPIALAAYEAQAFDGVVTQFFLDCFPDGELALLWREVARCLRFEGWWRVLDFNASDELSGWRSIRQRLLVWTLYRAFRLTSDIRAVRLPDMEKPFRRARWTRIDDTVLFGGIYRQTLWQKPAERG